MTYTVESLVSPAVAGFCHGLAAKHYRVWTENIDDYSCDDWYDNGEIDIHVRKDWYDNTLTVTCYPVVQAELDGIVCLRTVTTSPMKIVTISLSESGWFTWRNHNNTLTHESKEN